LKPDYIVCMDCGKKQKTLKRHLMTAHRMTPDQYRKDYGLLASYPMVAADYSKRRRGLANAIGLGRRKGGAEAALTQQGSKGWRRRLMPRSGHRKPFAVPFAARALERRPSCIRARGEPLLPLTGARLGSWCLPDTGRYLTGVSLRQHHGSP
jgi:hypothetical protein